MKSNTVYIMCPASPTKIVNTTFNLNIFDVFLYGRKVKLPGLFINSFISNSRRPAFTRFNNVVLSVVPRAAATS